MPKHKTKNPCFGYGLRRVAFNVAALLVLSLALYAPNAAADETKRIMVLGDSLVAGYGLAETEAFPSQLQEALIAKGLRVEVINAGVSGDTSAGGLARVGWSLSGNAADLPGYLIVELGANDGLRGLPPASTKDNLIGIVKAAQAKGLSVLLAGMLAPPNLGPDYGRDYNALFPAVAEQTGIAFYPFFLDGVAAEPHLNLADGIHPNAEGVAVIVERILPTVLDWLGHTPQP